MDTSFFLRGRQFVTTVAGAVHSQRGILSAPSYRTLPHLSYADVEARYGRHFDRAMRMSVNAFHELVDLSRPSLPHQCVSPEVRGAISLRCLGGRSYVDCAA